MPQYYHIADGAATALGETLTLVFATQSKAKGKQSRSMWVQPWIASSLHFVTLLAMTKLFRFTEFPCNDAVCMCRIDSVGGYFYKVLEYGGMEKLGEIPAPLCEIPEPPKALYVEGRLPSIEDHYYIAFVGSRRNSNYGKQVCEEMVGALAGTNAVVVSGLAIGIDAIAHKAALRYGVITVAVPGSGLDRRVLYPRQHVALAEEILAAGGALLSEFEPTFRANTYTFPRRNRIMAGLCRAVFIVEASERSGTLITARLATEYNRTVFTVPQNIHSPTAAGPSMLLRLGATPITSPALFLEELGLAPRAIEAREDLSERERAILAQLEESRSIDELSEIAALSIAELGSTLMMMELKGLIVERLGKYQRM